MGKKEFDRLVAEFNRKSRLYPSGERPWEWPLRHRIRDEVLAGRARGATWAFQVKARRRLFPGDEDYLP